MPERWSIRDLAAQLNLSPITVSRCLRNDPRHSPETRQRVQHLAQQLGYAPDAILARRMRDLRSGSAAARQSIAVISGDPKSSLRHLPVLARQYQGLRQRARQRGLEARWLSCQQPELLPQLLAERSCDTFCLLPLTTAMPASTWRFPSLMGVALGSRPAGCELPLVAHDHAQGMDLALRTVQARGYRRPGLFCPRSLLARSSGAWLGAFLATAQDQRLDWPTACICNAGDPRPQLRQWLASERPDAVIAPGSGVLHQLRSIGCRIPQELVFIDLDRHPDTEHAGIDQDHEAVGAHAVDLVLEAALGHPAGHAPARHLVPGLWRNGNSVRAS